MKLDPHFLTSLDVDRGHTGTLLVGRAVRYPRVTARHHVALYRDVGFLTRGIGGHAIRKEHVSSRNWRREEAASWVVTGTDVGGDDVVDYGALGSHAEGVRRVVGLKRHIGLGSACGGKHAVSLLTRLSTQAND